MTGKTVYFALYPTDFLADVGHLGNTELGIYWRLLLVYYRDQRPLPFEADKLRRLAMTFSPEECKALESVLVEFFVLTAQADGTRCWRHKRADREIEAAKSALESRVRRTASARKARWSKSSVTESVTGSVTESVTGCSQTENQNQNQIREKKEKKGASRLELPSWLPADVWADWHAYRSQRKGWTRKAQELSLHTLSDLHAEGCDPRDVVNRSIERGWTGLFPTKGKAAVGDDLMAGAL